MGAILAAGSILLMAWAVFVLGYDHPRTPYTVTAAIYFILVAIYVRLGELSKPK